MRWVLVGFAVALAACQAHQASPRPRTAAKALHAKDALDRHFGVLRDSLQAEGLGAGALFERGFLPPSGRTAFAVRVKPAQCSVFVALATASMSDLDAALFTAEGDALEEDESASSRPSLTLCAAEHPVEAYFTLHAYQGAGSFIAAQFTRPARADDDLHTAADGRVLSPLGRLSQLLHARGFEDLAPRVELPLGDARPVRLALNVDAGECYTLAAEASGGLSEVGLRLVDEQGGELADGVAEPNLSALQYCADRSAELAVEVVARRGQGIARVARFRAAQALIGGSRALWLVEPTPSAAAWSAAKSDPSVGAGKPQQRERVVLRQGEVRELERKRLRGPCERWEAALQPGLSRATLRVESGAGVLLGEDDAVRMRACVTVCDPGRQRRITLLGRAGFGSVILTATPEEAAGAGGSAAGCAGCQTEGAGCAPAAGADAP